MAGVSKQVITRSERAEVNPDLQTILGIVNAFGVAMGWLATGYGPIFADDPPGLVKLGNPSLEKLDDKPFQAAVQLLASSPDPLDFALIEYVPPRIGSGFAATGGIFLQPKWLASRRCGLVLPTSLSAYQKVAWLSSWVSVGHRFRGAFTLTLDKATELSLMSPGFVSESQAGRVAWPWLVRITHPPDRVVFPEIDQVRASLPITQVERLEEALRSLESQSHSSEASELVNIINNHPEVVPPLHAVARQLLSRRPQEDMGQHSKERKERK
jgi:transcriptional regulator with XRE-family HTH domain